jgi:hypothetical protein
VSFAAVTLCIASQRMFIVVDFFTDSVRKLLVTPSYRLIIFTVKYTDAPNIMRVCFLHCVLNAPSCERNGCQVQKFTYSLENANIL